MSLIAQVLWPSLLEYVTQESYTESVGVLCSNIAHIASKKREEEAEDYPIDFEANPNIPKPDALIARLMVRYYTYSLPTQPDYYYYRVLPLLSSFVVPSK